MLPAMCSLNKMPLVLHATIRTSLSKRTVGRLCIHISFSGGYLVSNFGHRVISQEIFSFYFSILFKFKWTCLFEYLIVAHLVKKFQILMNTVICISFAKDGEFSKQHGFSGMTPFPGVCKLRSTETRGNFFM